MEESHLKLLIIGAKEFTQIENQLFEKQGFKRKLHRPILVYEKI